MKEQGGAKWQLAFFCNQDVVRVSDETAQPGMAVPHIFSGVSIHAKWPLGVPFQSGSDTPSPAIFLSVANNAFIDLPCQKWLSTRALGLRQGADEVAHISNQYNTLIINYSR